MKKPNQNKQNKAETSYNHNYMNNKVKTEKFEYEEEVKEFTGLIFHCPNCDEVFHLHIADVKLKEKGKCN